VSERVLLVKPCGWCLLAYWYIYGIWVRPTVPAAGLLRRRSTCTVVLVASSLSLLWNSVL
jgi:hypothetical protein